MKNPAWGSELEDNAVKLWLNWAAGQLRVHLWVESSLDEFIQTKGKASPEWPEHIKEKAPLIRQS